MPSPTSDHRGVPPSSRQVNNIRLPAHGKAWFAIPALCPLQRNQVCLSLGPDFCRSPRQETGRMQTRQRRSFPCRQEIGAFDFRYGEIQTAVPCSGVISPSYPVSLRWDPPGPLFCYTLFQPSTFFVLPSPSLLEKLLIVNFSV